VAPLTATRRASHGRAVLCPGSRAAAEMCCPAAASGAANSGCPARGTRAGTRDSPRPTDASPVTSGSPPTHSGGRGHQAGRTEAARSDGGHDIAACVSWLRSVPGLIRIQPAHRDQAQPEAADPGQQPLRRGLVGQQDRDDGLRAVASGRQAAEPVRPPAVENAPDADLVAGRPGLAGHAGPPSLRTAIASPRSARVLLYPARYEHPAGWRVTRWCRAGGIFGRGGTGHESATGPVAVRTAAVGSDAGEVAGEQRVELSGVAGLLTLGRALEARFATGAVVRCRG